MKILLCCKALALDNFYIKPIDNLSTMKWQHATADYNKILQKGTMVNVCGF